MNIQVESQNEGKLTDPLRMNRPADRKSERHPGSAFYTVEKGCHVSHQEDSPNIVQRFGKEYIQEADVDRISMIYLQRRVSVVTVRNEGTCLQKTDSPELVVLLGGVSRGALTLKS
jgi:hypothetical protein